MTWTTIALLLLVFLLGVLTTHSSMRLLARRLFSGRETSVNASPPVTGDNSAKRFGNIHESASGVPLTAGNSVELLLDGPSTYREMLRAIRSATDHVHLQSYTFIDGEAAAQFSELLIEKAERGLAVKIVFDALGSFEVSRRLVSKLEQSGVQVRSFQRSLDLRFWRMHQRDHRKMLIVDGHIGFVGGINITDEYLGEKSAFDDSFQPPEQRGWHDLHARTEGPVVADLQRLFLSVWLNMGRDVSMDNCLFPEPIQQGNCLASIVASDRLDSESRIVDGQIAAMQAATQSILITHAYFVPPREFVDALKAAVIRGVDVRLILPSFSDNAPALYASHAHFEELLAAGVRIFEFKPRMLHSKTMVVDTQWLTIGSSNLDIRSLEHNNEANLVVVDPQLAEQMTQRFEADLGQTEEVLLDDWLQRSVLQRIKERAALVLKYWL
ncbi:MAG: cardiolipin synthase [Pseudomonadales bacterium]